MALVFADDGGGGEAQCPSDDPRLAPGNAANCP